LTLRKQRAIRADKARVIRRLKRGLTLSLVALATVAALAWMTATALAQVPDQNRQCSTIGVIRVGDLEAKQLVDCDSAREVASDWLYVRWNGGDASFQTLSTRGYRGSVRDWAMDGIVWRPGRTPPTSALLANHRRMPTAPAPR
jgi:hypothetical protein